MLYLLEHTQQLSAVVELVVLVLYKLLKEELMELILLSQD
jgi:hypothetical protein